MINNMMPIKTVSSMEWTWSKYLVVGTEQLKKVVVPDLRLFGIF